MQVSTILTTAAAAGARRAAVALCVAALAAAAFGPALDAGFVSWDDGLTVTDNYAIRELSAQSVGWMWSTSHAGHYQPLAWTSLAIDHALYGLSAPDFPEARGYHATNLALHAATAAALFALALALLGYTRAGAAVPAGALALAAAAAALLHAVHPLRCESVCWITERRDVLSAPFFLLALLAYLRATPPGPVTALRPRWLALCALASAGALACAAASLSLADPQRLALRGPGAAGLAAALALLGVAVWASARGVGGARARRSGWWLAAHVLLLVSLCTKAWGITMPALWLVLDAWPLGRLARTPEGGVSRARPLAALALEKLPVAALALAFARLAAWAQTAQQGRVDVLGVHTPGERLVQALYGLSFYPRKTLLPTGLAPLYPIPDDVSLAEPRFLAGAALTLGLCALGVLLWRRAPAVTAALAAYAIGVAPVLGVLQSGPQLVADRYAYLAGIPFALLAGGALLLGWRRGGALRAATAAAALAALLALSALAWRQSAIWHDSESLWTRAYQHAPEAPLAALNLGLVRADQAARTRDAARRAALRDEALRLVGEAAARRPESGLYLVNEAIVRADRAADRPEPERSLELARADALARRAIAVGEARGLADASWYFQHGRMLGAAARADEAIARYERALALRPGWPVPRLWLAATLLDAAQRDARDPARALAQVERAERELDAARASLGSAPEPRSLAAARARAAALRAALAAAAP